MIVRGFDRPNIRLEVERHDEADASPRADRARRSTPGPGIVYCATKKAAEEVAEELRERGVNAQHYHGGLSAEGARERAPAAFMETTGST